MSELIGIGRRAAAAAPSAPPAPEETPPAPAAALSGLSTYRIETWGCQMNDHDSEKMAGVLRSFGLRPAATEADADIILLNTCSIREKAAHKVFTRLGQLRQQKLVRPRTVIGVCGCVAQQEQERIFARAPYVDLVMGPRRIASLPNLIEESRHRRHVLGVLDPKDRLVPEVDAIDRVSRTRAYITVMEGCNKTCTYCIVPFTRGREVCRPPAEILAEASRCVSEGRIELELLGQNVNAWHHAGEGDGEWDFARLLRESARLAGVRRVRFTTSHPLHFRDPIIEAMAGHEAICRHLHLPVQSGSDTVLSRMRRGYTGAEYRGRIATLRARVPDIALSTDIIVGFPGETDADFELTMDLVREIRFDNVFSFLYSPRPHTPATGLPDDISPAVKKARLRRLQRLQEGIRMERVRCLEGATVEVLVDGPAARGAGRVGGRTSQNLLVHFEGDASLIGRVVSVRIERAGPHSLSGTIESGLTSAPSHNIDRSVRTAS